MKRSLPIIGGLLLLLIALRGYPQADSPRDHRFDYFLKGGDFVMSFGDTQYKKYMMPLLMRRAKAMHIKHFIIRNHYEKEIMAFCYANKGDSFYIYPSTDVCHPTTFHVEKTGWQIITGVISDCLCNYWGANWKFTKWGLDVDGNSWETKYKVEDP